ncbi:MULTISPECIES: hypothetical protein [unclassified Variovorax]|jgi:hypothetical protein|uniref:hypothetical protein n=1 Tax=unclassified Variovorax TaxID=663243 RepID=UPI000FB0EE50|nr:MULTISPECIES: hypothetical protein [unclassified Variovorax]RSZ47732.1 hypothetical protein EJO70_03795 [Variovorax sp. 553]RSZ48141.1 hypothetical protein EJO71_00190 [Variovorax sp. 679]
MSFHRTDWIATYAAVVATAVFVWDIVKWRRAGPKLEMHTRGNMKFFGSPGVDERLQLIANVSNVGDRATTLTNMTLEYFPSKTIAIAQALLPNWFSWGRKRLFGGTKGFVVAAPNVIQPFPHTLEAGAVWIGTCPQDEELVRLSRDGCLYCVIASPHLPRGIRRRVIITPYEPLEPVGED